MWLPSPTLPVWMCSSLPHAWPQQLSVAPGWRSICCQGNPRPVLAPGAGPLRSRRAELRAGARFGSGCSAGIPHALHGSPLHTLGTEIHAKKKKKNRENARYWLLALTILQVGHDTHAGHHTLARILKDLDVPECTLETSPGSGGENRPL
jgi:hypothetical protein